MTMFKREASAPQRIAGVLRARKVDLLERWRKRVLQDPELPDARRLSEPLLLDHIPEFIDTLADKLAQLGREDAGEQAGIWVGESAVSRTHVQLRFDNGYSLRETLEELAQLQLSILELLHEEGEDPGGRAAILLSATFSRAMLVAAEELGTESALYRLERSHRQEREMLRTIIERSGDGIVVADGEGIVRVVNPAAQSIHGVKPRQVPPEKWAEAFGLVTGDDSPLPLEQQPLFRALKGESITDAEVHVRRPDGSLRIVTTTATPLADHATEGAMVILRDETDFLLQQRALLESEARARSSEERLRLLIDGAHDYAIFMLDPKGYVVSWNVGAERITGFSSAEVIGRPCLVLHRPDEAEETLQHLGAAAAQGRHAYEGVHLRKDGSPIWASETLTALRGEAGELRGYAVVLHDVTEQKQAAEALRRSRERLRLILESIRDYAVFMLDTEGRVTSWNPGAERILGYSADEIVGRDYACFFPPGDEVALQKARQRLEALRTREQQEDEGWRVRKDGSHFWASVVVSAIRDEDGSFVGATTIIRDITERKQAEEALKRSEARWRRLFEANVIGTFVVRMSGEVLDANDAFLQTAGYSREDLETGRLNWMKMTPLGLLPLDEEAIRELREHGVCIPYEKEYVRKDGSRVPVLIGAALLDKVSEECVCFVLDLSERKRHEEALVRLLQEAQTAQASAEAAKERLAFLAEASVRFSASLEPEATCRAITELAVPRLADWCGVDLVAADDTLERVIVSCADGIDTQIAGALKRAHPHEGGLPPGTMKVLRTGRSEFVAEVTESTLEALAQDPTHLELLRRLNLRSLLIVPLKARDRVLGAVWFGLSTQDRWYGSEDIAALQELARRAALALENASLYREAQEAIRARDQFIGIASHELRTPISTLELQVHAFRRLVESSPEKTTEPERVRKLMESVSRQSRRMLFLINDLLDVSRIAAGRLELELAEVDLRDVVEAVLDRLADALHQVHCPVTVHAPAPVVGRWDPMRLEQVVTNLLTNASKYGPGQPIEISIRADDDAARLSVRDHGHGIAPEDQARIFEPFERATNNHAAHSLGLGLHISQAIIQAHHGSIRVESEPGQGATFTFELPYDGGSRRAKPGQRMNAVGEVVDLRGSRSPAVVQGSERGA